MEATIGGLEKEMLRVRAAQASFREAILKIRGNASQSLSGAEKDERKPVQSLLQAYRGLVPPSFHYGRVAKT